MFIAKTLRCLAMIQPHHTPCWLWKTSFYTIKYLSDVSTKKGNPTNFPPRMRNNNLVRQ